MTPRITLRQLQIFVAVAQGGGTTVGGARIALSQSATSAGLVGLEQGLGTRLFERVGRRLVLNDAGRALLPEARAMLDAAARIEAQFAAGGAAPAYTLRVGASTTIANYILPGVVARFCARHPRAEIAVDVANTREVIAAVEGFEVDLGFIEGPCLSASLTALPWAMDELVIVCAPHHALAKAARKRALALTDLADARWLMREPGHARGGGAGAGPAPQAAALADAARQRRGDQAGCSGRARHHVPVAACRARHAGAAPARAPRDAVASPRAPAVADPPARPAAERGTRQLHRPLPRCGSNAQAGTCEGLTPPRATIRA
jgi:DNA-binding transcriptional LysR family regulator